MRITLDIPGTIYRQLKGRAASEGETVGAFILRAVVQALQKPRRKVRRPVKLPLVRSKEPGTLDLDNAKIYEVISFS